jgi:hypothetical protein
MTVAVSKRNQDVEHSIGEWQEELDIVHGGLYCPPLYCLLLYSSTI